MPLFLYFMLAFLYFIQIFTLQERLQTAITQMGLNLGKSAYFYSDFPDLTDAINFDKTIFSEEITSELNNITDKVVSNYGLSLYATKYMDQGKINLDYIKGGFKGIDFSLSTIKNKDNRIDIILKYKICLPLQIFQFSDINMLQRVRMNAWTGFSVAAAYGTENDSKETIVYITETGSVYHKSIDCTHIKLSIRAVNTIPHDLRNNNGGKYYACESCCKGSTPESATYYITNDGTRYHTKKECSKLKRSVKSIPLSDVGDKKACTRCGK